MSIRLLGICTLVLAILGPISALEDWETKIQDISSVYDHFRNARSEYKDDILRVFSKKSIKPPTCPTPNPYAAYSLGPLGSITNQQPGPASINSFGQNGWNVASSTYTTESITSTSYHEGTQSWFVGNCRDVCDVPNYATYPGAGLGGFGNGIAGETEAPANRVRLSVWIRSSSPLPVGGNGFGFVDLFLDGADNTVQPLTQFRFGNIAGNNVLVAQATEVTGGVPGTPVYRSQTSPALVAGRWYNLITDLTFKKGELNDKVKYEVRDASGNSVWKVDLTSLEHAYWLNSGIKVFARRFSLGNRVGMDVTPAAASTANMPLSTAGFYIDDISITTWNSADPHVPLYCFSTGFEAVAAYRCYGYDLVDGAK